MDDKQEQPSEDEEKPKKGKITRKDWTKVEIYLKNELQNRKTSSFRVAKEQIWKEIDRQISMQPMVKINRDGSPNDDWHSTIELGELSKASENISADVRRIIFPQSRFWFEAHSDVKEAVPFDKQGNKPVDQKVQQLIDGRLRSFMVQQHNDFGLKDSVELSVKEALHHGSFVAEVDWRDQEMVFEGTKTKTISCGNWIPHSMWNCYPDPSPSVVGTSMFYSGSMFIDSYLPRYKCEKMIKSGEDGWLESQWKKVSKDEHKVKDQNLKDVKITTYWGDVNVEKQQIGVVSGEPDLFFPNHKVMLFNGTIVYIAPVETPYPPIIFKGYERTDVRDPYYTSPIVKQSPMQKLASVLANKTVDGIGLSLEPPITYDGNDPDFVLNGGPTIKPGSKVSSKGTNSFQQVKIGDPAIAIQGLELCLQQMKEKLGAPGPQVGDRATKAEVVKASQDQEVSLVDFIDKMEIALRSYLYMQHELNVRKLIDYSYYSPEMLDPDFLRITKKDLPKSVHFEVVGARGVLGEQERTQKLTAVTAFASGNPFFTPLLDAKAILMQMFQDAGLKNAERFMVNDDKETPQQLKQQLEQAKQGLQQMGQENQQLENHEQSKMAKIQADAQAKQMKLEVEAKLKEEKNQKDFEARILKIQADAKAEMARMLEAHHTAIRGHILQAITADAQHSLQEKAAEKSNQASQ